MTTQTDNLKPFGGRFEPQKGALKKDPKLPIYVAFVWTKNKSIAKTLLHAEFLKFAPDYSNNYFAPKVWEAVPGSHCTSEGQFYTDFFTDSVVWNAEKGEPERVLTEPELADHEEDFQQEDLPPAEKMTLVKNLDLLARSYCLAMFGPVEEVNASQYSQMIDLYNDDVSSPIRDQAEGISKEPRVLALLPEKQTECLAWVRQEAKPGSQWPDYKNLFTKWCDTPPAKRNSVKIGNNATEKLSISELQQRNTLLRYRIALGVISRSMDFDINNIPVGIELRANSMLNDKSETDITDWFVVCSRTPGIHDFHLAAIIAIIKTAEDKISHYPGELIKYIDKCISDFDCVNPEPLIFDIACGRSSAPLPQKNSETPLNTQTEQTLSSETEIPAVCPSRAAELNRELDAVFANSASNEGEKKEVTEQEDTRKPMDAREIGIAHALNELMSGHTTVMDKSDVDGVLSCTGHLLSHVVPLLLEDIAMTESCLSPEFSDDDIHHVATDILDSWSDDEHVRRKIAMDSITDDRKPIPVKMPEPVVIDPPVVTAKPKEAPEPITVANNTTCPLSYQQQLTIAALQGLCANPAYCGSYEDLPSMAAWLASTVTGTESGQ